jgi:hypothetical protein
MGGCESDLQTPTTNAKNSRCVRDLVMSDGLFRTRSTAPGQRLVELDALRGLMLVWITLTHLPTTVSKYVYQPLGYVAATEGFIFLSALFTGLIYFRISERQGLRTMWRRLWTRAGRLYCYHLSLLLFAFLVGARIATRSYRPAIHNLLDFYFAAGRTRAFIDAALMLYRPPLLDILPIYIIFLAFTPLAIVLGRRLGWRYVLAGCFVLWFLAQFGFRGFVHELLTRSFGLHIPLNETGAFDLWAWQFWWVVGLYIGVRWAQADLHLGWARQMAVPAAIVAVFFLVLRYSEAAGFLELGKFAVLLNKWDFGAGRIIDAAALAILAIRFQSTLKSLAVRPLVLLGQASLEVFCVQLFCVFVALAALGADPVLSGWKAAVAIFLSLFALVVTSRLMANRRLNKAGHAASQLVVQPAIRKAA